MQNSLVQITACGRDDVFFFLFWAEIRTSVDAIGARRGYSVPWPPYGRVIRC